MTDEELRSYVGRLIELRTGEESIVGELRAEQAPGSGITYTMKVPTANIDDWPTLHEIGDASRIDSVHILPEEPEMID